MATVQVKTQATVFKYTDFSDKVSLGKGEFGEVYGAKHPMFPKVAVKILSRSFHATEQQKSALLEETGTLLSISSEQVLRLLGVVMETHHLCLVFEYAEYGSLDKVLKRCQLQWPLKIRIAYHIALGMHFLHDRGILHLRLKCCNVLIDKNMGAKISDLYHGGNKMQTWTTRAITYSQNRPHDVTIVHPSASIAYIPPELILDANITQGKSSDVYAYGIILWQIITNESPYRDETYAAICDAVRNGGRPSLELIPQDTPIILRSLMMNAWKQQKGERPTFEKMKKVLEPSFNENCDEAVASSIQCQRVLNDFNRQYGLYISAPESDVVPPKQWTNPPEQPTQPDGGAHSRVGDRTLVKEPQSKVTKSEQAKKEPTVRWVEPGDKLTKATPFTEEEPVESSRYHGEDENPGIIPVINDQEQQVPAEGSPKNADAENFYIVATELGRNWRRFGLHLGFSDGELDCVEANYITSGHPETGYQMLRKWREKENGNITLGYLVSKLKEYNYTYIARKLKA